MKERLPPGVLRRRLGEFLRPHRLALTVAGLAVVLSTLVTLSGPLLIAYAIDEGLGEGDRGALKRAALAFLAITLLKPFLERTVIRLAARVGERFLAAMRTAAFERLQQLSLDFFEGERAGVLVSRLTADVQSLSLFVRQVLVDVVGSVLTLAITFVILLSLSPTLAAASLVALPVLAGATIYFQRRSTPVYLAIRDRVGDTMSALQEGLTGMRVVQSFAREPEVYERYLGRSAKQVQAWRRAAFVNIRFFPTIVLGQVIGTASVLVVGGILVERGSVTVGVVSAFVLYLIGLFDPIARLGDWLLELQTGRASLTKIVALLETPAGVTERPDALEPAAVGMLAAEHVSFAYEDKAVVLRDVSLAVAPGERVALVGPTGAGKSTLAKLLCRQYDPDSGRVTFSGVDLRDLRLGSLRSRISLVPQEGHLFSGSIADNVRLARPEASDQDVAAALARIGALERFQAFPNGIHTDVQTRGVRLSAGERQLVGLARVALAEPAVIVLDEATSSLDPGTERAVERALAAVSEGRTVITIAHRLSTARRADRIGALHDGRLVELGSHDDLLALDGRYAGLWRSWQANDGVERTVGAETT